MANVQLAVAGDDTTQVILSVPGVQGPAGSNLPPSGTTNQVLYKQSSTDYDTGWSLVTSAMITDGTIVNGDINASAAIAGTKISPDFGSQTVQTTGIFSAAGGSAAAPSIAFTGDTNTGIYSPGADQVAISTGGSGRLFVNGAGSVGIGTASPAAPFDCSIGDRGLQVSAVTASHVQLTGTQGSTSSNLRPMRLAAQTLSFNTGASTGASYTERVFIDTNGNVGIGTPNAAANIHVLNSSGTEVRVACSIVTGDSHLNLWEGNGVSGNADTTRLGVGKNNTALIYTNSTGTARAAFAIGTTGPEPLVLSTNNTERLRITSAGLVGIGTTSPGTILDVVGAGNPTLTIRGSDGAYTGILNIQAAGGGTSSINATGGSNALKIETNSVERLRITSAGLVGIGVTDPGSYNSAAANLVIGSTTANTGLTIRSGATGVADRVGSIYFADGTTGNEAYRGYIDYAHSIDTLAIGTSGLPRLVIDSSGRLLVGTSTARSVGSGSQATVQVETTSYVAFSGVNNTNDAGGCTLNLGKSRGTAVGSATSVLANDTLGTINFAGADGTDVVSVGAQIQAQVDGTPGANDMPGRIILSTTADGAASPTERMRIRSDGKVLLGTTTVGFGSQNGFTFEPDSASYQTISHPNGASSGTDYLIFGYNGSKIGSITQNGTTAVAYNTSSDYRLKENVTAVTDGIIRLLQLRPSRFNFISDPDRDVDGFIAHEVQVVVPEAITGEKDAVDDDGNPVYQGIDQSKLVPLLTAALQEAVAKIETLEARLTAAGI